MKRRIFISTAGLAGTFISSGFASTSSLLTPTAPWHFNDELDGAFVEALDVFANQIKGIQHDLHSNKLVRNLVTPKKVISQDLNNKVFIYENFVSNQISISRKNGEIVVKISECL
jgi:hypothetical protein